MTRKEYEQRFANRIFKCTVRCAHVSANVSKRFARDLPFRVAWRSGELYVEYLRGSSAMKILPDELDYALKKGSIVEIPASKAAP